MTTPTITSPPTPLPQRTEPDFSARRDAFVVWQDTNATELQAHVTWTEAQVTATAADVVSAQQAVTDAQAQVTLAEAEAAAAAASATAAAATANAALWVSGTNYAEGDNAISPTDYQTYRANKALTPSTVDAASASSDWEMVGVTQVVDFQEFTTSDTWNKPDGINYALIELVGAGGGGGNSNANDGAGGGGGGAGVRRLMRASELSATEAVTIGAGGAGGATGSDTDGTGGGNTTFGSHITARGGKPGYRGGTSVPQLTLADKTYMAGGGGEYVSYTGSTLALVGNGGFGSGSGAFGYGVGGDAVIGGGGGGGCYSSSNSYAGGVSELGGDGGAGVGTASTKGGDGVVPGGGGGASANNGGGGDGADGRVRVWCW